MLLFFCTKRQKFLFLERPQQREKANSGVSLSSILLSLFSFFFCLTRQKLFFFFVMAKNVQGKKRVFAPWNGLNNQNLLSWVFYIVFFFAWQEKNIFFFFFNFPTSYIYVLFGKKTIGCRNSNKCFFLLVFCSTYPKEVHLTFV